MALNWSLGKGLLVVAVVALETSFTQAGNPQVNFDFGRVTECTEIASDGDSALFPNEKLIEVKLRVSVHLLAGNIADVEEVRIEVGDCDNRMRVHSFSPATQLASHLSGDIQWSKTTEESRSLGASLGGELPVALGSVVAHVTPSVNGGLGNVEKITETQTRVAPQFAVVASGTISQEHGVFFKLRSSPQSTLEGTHEFVIRFVVGEKWRGDSIQICCQATGTEKVLWMKQQTAWSHVCSNVALFLAGDLQARQAAIRFIGGNERG